MKSSLFLSLIGLAFHASAQEAVSTPIETSTPETEVASVASAGSPQVGLFSAKGPGQGEAVWGLGMRTLLVVPMLDINLAYGATKKLSIEARASAIGVPVGGGGSIGMSIVEAGARYQL